MSGRALRRLPVLACARYIGVAPLGNVLRRRPAGASDKKGKKNASLNGMDREGEEEESDKGTAVEVWLDGMERVVESQAVERSRFR